MLNFRAFLSRKWKRILIFNVSRKSVAALEADFNFDAKKVRPRRNLEFLAPRGNDFNKENILGCLDKVLRSLSKSTSLVFLFEKPFLKSTLSAFSIVRTAPSELIDEDELENVILNLAWRLYDRERPIVGRALGISEFEIILTSSQIKDPKIDGRKILNPLGFAGRRLGFTFENTYSQRDFWGKLMKIIQPFKGDLNFLSENLLVFDKVFSLLGEKGILIDIGCEETKVGQLGDFLKNFQSFNWGEENLTRSIAKSLCISLGAAEVLKEKYKIGNLSSRGQRWLEKILVPELKLLAEGIGLAIKNFSLEDSDGANLYLNGALLDFPQLLEFFRNYSWPKAVFKRRPAIQPYQKERIFDKMDLKVEAANNIGGANSLVLAIATAALFMAEPAYHELNKILKRRIKWLK